MQFLQQEQRRGEGRNDEWLRYISTFPPSSDQRQGERKTELEEPSGPLVEIKIHP